MFTFDNPPPRLTRLGPWALLIVMCLAAWTGCEDPEELPPPPPASFTYEPPALDFPSGVTTDTLTITNSGGSAGSFTLNPSAAWLSVAPTDAVLAAGASTTITVTVCRTGLPSGTHSGHLTVASNTTSELPVSVSVPEAQLVWFESWEGSMARWSQSDADARNGFDYWDDILWPEAAPCGRWLLYGAGFRTIEGSGGYDDYMDARCELRPAYAIDISNYRDVRIEFNLAYLMEQNYDKVYFEIYVNGGWYRNDRFTWTGGTWAWLGIVVRQSDWSHWDPNQLRFRWRYVTDGSVHNFPGAVVDCVSVYGTPATCSGVVSQPEKLASALEPAADKDVSSTLPAAPPPGSPLETPKLDPTKRPELAPDPPDSRPDHE